MKSRTLKLIAVLVVTLACGPIVTAGNTLLDSLQPDAISSMRITLKPGGAEIGFEAEFSGDDPAVGDLVAVIRTGEPGGDHKCVNAGSIRFTMRDGSVIGVGLLPAHTGDHYGLRLYDGDRLVTCVRVERYALLEAVEALGVPMDDPAFRD